MGFYTAEETVSRTKSQLQYNTIQYKNMGTPLAFPLIDGRLSEVEKRNPDSIVGL